MDYGFNNVFEGTRQYFMGLPKQAQAEGSGQPVWPTSAPPPEEGAPAQSGAPAPSSRPPSAAAAPPSTPGPTVIAPPPRPPRPPSEPIEPEPHIIHKATVMREAAEKRREMPDPEDEEEPMGALSPPSHIIRKPTPRTLPSPAPAPAAPCPSPARPPSAAPLARPTSSEPQIDQHGQYRSSIQRVQTPTARPPDQYTPSRPPDPYSSSRPPESFARFPYEPPVHDGGRNSHGPPVASPQPVPARHSPTTYARLSSVMPQHAVARLRESAVQSPPSSRYSMQPAQAPPPHNDRVPPIHHPQAPPPTQRVTVEGRSAQAYLPPVHRRESSLTRSSHYDRHPSIPARKYDPQQAYPGYRPSLTTQNHRVEALPQYKHSGSEGLNTHFAARPSERAQTQPMGNEPTRIQPRIDFHGKSRSVDTRPSYHYPSPSTSHVRYAPSAPVPTIQHNASLQPRTSYRGAAVAKTSYNYSPVNQVQSSPSRSSIKAGYSNQQTRMTVSVTSIVNELNQTKKRESPLDLSVKTVKNSADSSTTQDDAIDSASYESKSLPLQPRPTSSSRQVPSLPGYIVSHKVDFAPDFNQYRDRNTNHNCATPPQPVRYNGTYETARPAAERISYPVESRHHHYADRSKYNGPVQPRTDYVPRIDLTRSVADERQTERVREDPQIVMEERKRPAGPIVSNIPEKLVRYETWTSDSRIERMSQSAREQHELMSRPVYSYSSHKRFEAYQNDQKRVTASNMYRDHHPHTTQRHSRTVYPEKLNRDISDYQAHYHDRVPTSSRHVIQKIPSHKDVHPQHLDVQNGPANKSVLSILRNSLETKQTGYVETTRPIRQISDVIVLDDVDDSVIEITDLTKDGEQEPTNKNNPKMQSNQNNPILGHHIQMPKAVDSFARDSVYQKCENSQPKSKSPENDVAARIRTKAELKVMPPSQDSNQKQDKSSDSDSEKVKILPKSQKQHLFNQIREDNLRLESVIKNEKPTDEFISEVKAEPMNIDEIEKDAVASIKSENILGSLEPENLIPVDQSSPEDLDWASACDSFMEQLKTGCLKKKNNRKRNDTLDHETEVKIPKVVKLGTEENSSDKTEIISTTVIEIKQEPIDEDEKIETETSIVTEHEELLTEIPNEIENHESVENKDKKDDAKTQKSKTQGKNKTKLEKKDALPTSSATPVKNDSFPTKTVIKEEMDSTDEDEPLIKSKIMKEKVQRELKYQMLKDLSEKSVYVKLECCDEQVSVNSRKSTETISKDKVEKPAKGKTNRLISKTKGKTSIAESKNEKRNDISSSDSDDDVSVASRLRVRKVNKSDDNKNEIANKTPTKSSPSKKLDTSSASNSSTPIRKPGFGDGSNFHPGWEDELYKYKRSLRMPTRLIAIPRGRSGEPFAKGSANLFTRGSTSLPDLDPVPLSPAPSSSQSAATDDLYGRRPDKMNLDSDLDSNSSCSAPNRLQYDSEASTSTVFSACKVKKKSSSIVDVLIQKYGKKEETKKKSKDKDEKNAKIMQKNSNVSELLPTPGLGLVKNGSKGNLSAKKEKLMEDIFYLGAFRKETVTAFRNAFIKNTDGLLGTTEEFTPMVLQTRTRTESRVLKQRATIKEVFGDERPASAPPTSCRQEEVAEPQQEKIVEVKKESEPKPKFKPRKIAKEKMKRRSSSIRDGLRSTKSLKRNDAKGRLLRLKKRNNLMKTFNAKRKESTSNKVKKEKSPTPENKDNAKEENSTPETAETNTKRRFKRLFGRRKFSSGFDYIRKKKKMIRKDDNNCNKIRRPAPKPSPESVHDIQKEIKSWFINKSIGETHLHRAARLGFTDCVAYCLEKMEADPSAKDNAGFTPLHVAAARGHVRIARLLLQYGANVSAAAQGGIRPLHEASENCHVEVIRLLLSYGADPLLGTYAGQTPGELAEGGAALLLRLHVADVQGQAQEPWRFPPPTEPIDCEELGCDPLQSPPPATPPPPADTTMEIQTTDAPLPPFYSLRSATGQPVDGLWCLLQDIANVLQIKSKDSLLKQIHCGSGSPKELLREIRTQEFLERAQCHQLLCAGEKVNVRASKVALIRVTDKLRQLLKIETVLVS
ncbi:uncharacterized protein LOC106720736 [Papilio machaon]|uniref:uncharacterized protein LOC106720736 n=1 Tax=Papilio machaon TaxID=76193 RepID=UPI001E665019|nr:uncharacterized protein LOC106720736 [Papilio machaon]